MFRKEDVIRTVASLGLDPAHYRLATGAALTLYGIRESTRDIDIGVDEELFEALLRRGYSINPEFPLRREILIPTECGDVELYAGWAQGPTETVEGIPCMTLDGIAAHKRSMGREKDLRDLELMEKYRKEHNL